jgi:ABC-type multidrug transport system fused ATPase/permease subunit
MSKAAFRLLRTGRHIDSAIALKLADGTLFGGQVVVAAVAISSFANTQSATMAAITLILITVIRGLILRSTNMRLYQRAYDDGMVLRRSILDRLVAMPLGIFAALKPGRLVQALGEDVLWLENHASSNRPEIAYNTTALIVLLGSAMVLSPLAGVTAVAAIGVGFLFLALIRNRLAQGLARRAGSLEHAALAMTEYCEGMPVLRAFGLGNATQPDFEAQVEHLRRGARKGVLSTTPLAVAFRGLVDLAIALAIVVALLSEQTTSDVAGFAAAAVLIAASAIPARNFAALLAMMTLAALARENISGILANPAMPTGSASALPNTASIRFHGVSFAYPGQTRYALEDVSFEAEPGQLTALVGHNGSGKTTCLQLMMRFHDVGQGVITIGGTDIKDMSTDGLSQLFAPVFQEPQLFHDTIANNIRIGRPEATDDEVVAAAKAAAIHDMIIGRDEGYQTMVGPRGRDLSGGERQRIAIARAILKDAPIILLDEATSALDPENENLIQAGLRSLVRQKTVLVVAHRLSTIVAADLIVVMSDGKVVAKGRHDTLIGSSPHYRELWNRFQHSQGWRPDLA